MKNHKIAGIVGAFLTLLGAFLGGFTSFPFLSEIPTLVGFVLTFFLLFVFADLFLGSGLFIGVRCQKCRIFSLSNTNSNWKKTNSGFKSLLFPKFLCEKCKTEGAVA